VGEKVDNAGAREAAHARYLALLERHLDGELDPSRREILFTHLEDCVTCREILEAEERLTDRLARIPRIIPPSDLRANILRELERERREAEPLPSDERYAPVLAAHRTTRRTRWQRYSPAFATTFLVFASIGWFLSGEAGGLQSIVMRSLRTAGSSMAQLAVRSDETAHQALRPAPLLAATPEPVRIAATPAPAETATATMAAIVLRPTDVDGGMSLDDDGVDRAIRETAQLVGPAAPKLEQFVFDGLRYRCYEIEVAERNMSELVASLDAYRAPAEPPILVAIKEQGGMDVPDEVDFFVAPRAVLHDAVLKLPAGGVQVNGRKHVRIFLLD
jgi:hypothetical protein